MSINGFGTNENARIDGLEEIYANYIYTDQLDIGSTFISQPVSYFTGVRSNIQAQIDGIYTDICYNVGRWGTFWDTTTQTNPVANAVNILKYNNSDPSNNGVYLDVSSTRITVLQEGVYNLQFSAQLTNNSATATEIYIWFRKNGTDIEESATAIQVSGSQAEAVAAWNYVTPMNTSDYLEIAWSSSGTGVQILALTASGSVPAIPSAIVTLTEVTGEGPIGPTGATPNITIGTVGAVPYGSIPTVTITGTTNNPVLNFELETGPQGIQGPQGPQGPEGPRGPKGDQAESTIEAIAAAATATAAAAAAAASAAEATVSAEAAAASAVAAETAAASIGADIAGLQAQIDVIDGDVAILQDKTVNITAVPGETTFTGTILTTNINSGTAIEIGSAGNITVATTGATDIGGGTLVTVASDTQANILAPIINIDSGVSGGGIINIGSGLTDYITIQGLPFVNINWNTTAFNQF